MPAPKTVYQLKVTLTGSKPSIWRRILVPDSVTLYELHIILQISMGWTDSHLHEFKINGDIYGDLENNEFGDLEIYDEEISQLNQCGLKDKKSFKYLYDFGDGWDHTILVEKIMPAEKGTRYPFCEAGKCACPPEDVGGLGGYSHFLQSIADPSDEEHEEYLVWIGGGFDPKHFDENEVSEQLRHYKRWVIAEPGQSIDFMESLEVKQKLSATLDNQQQELVDTLEALPLRRDMLTFLNYLAENRVTGTQSTGNLPLKHVRAICEKFIDPPELDKSIGETIFKLKSETEIWPIYFIHNLAEHGSLISGGPGIHWQITAAGKKFLGQAADKQVIFLLFTWWYRVDWRISGSNEFFFGDLSSFFIKQVLEFILVQPIDISLPFEIFADGLIAKTGLFSGIEDQKRARKRLLTVLQEMVVEPLSSFGLFKCEYKIKPYSYFGLQELKLIKLTSQGKVLLGML